MLQLKDEVNSNTLYDAILNGWHDHNSRASVLSLTNVYNAYNLILCIYIASAWLDGWLLNISSPLGMNKATSYDIVFHS